MVKKVFQLYLNTTNPTAQNVSQPTLIRGTCSVSAGSSILTANFENTMRTSGGLLAYYVPLNYGMQILIPAVTSQPIYVLTQITSGPGDTGTYYMSYTPLVTVSNTPYTGLENKNSYNFLVNWDSLFAEAKLSNYSGRTCKVGVDFVSQQSVLAFTNELIGSTLYRNGILTCNLATNTGNKNLPYTVLGNTDILNAPLVDPAILAVAPSYKSMYFNLNTMEETQMTQIIMPTGCSFLNLALYSYFTFTNLFTPQMIDVDWFALLSFEIDDDE